MVFTITGLLTGVCGLILMGQLEGADAFYGNGYELDVIAAAVIGGISLSGGEGNMLGIIVGAALMGVLKNAFVLLAVPGILADGGGRRGHHRRRLHRQPEEAEVSPDRRRRN